MARNYYDIPAAKMPANSILDFTPLNNGIQNAVTGWNQGYDNETNKLLGVALKSGNFGEAASIAADRGDLDKSLKITEIQQRNEDRAENKGLRDAKRVGLMARAALESGDESMIAEIHGSILREMGPEAAAKLSPAFRDPQKGLEFFSARSGEYIDNVDREFKRSQIEKNRAEAAKSRAEAGVGTGPFGMPAAPGGLGAPASSVAPAPSGGAHQPAAIRFNNPGAQYPGPSSQKFGSTGTEIIGGGHKIAKFDDPVQGAAAQFDLLDRGYAGMTMGQIVQKWSGGNNSAAYAQHLSKATGVPINAPITKEMLRDPAFAVPFAKASAQWETGKPFPMSDEQWTQAHSMAFGGAAPVRVASLEPTAGMSTVGGGGVPQQMAAAGNGGASGQGGGVAVPVAPQQNRPQLPAGLSWTEDGLVVSPYATRRKPPEGYVHKKAPNDGGFLWRPDGTEVFVADKEIEHRAKSDNEARDKALAALGTARRVGALTSMLDKPLDVQGENRWGNRYETYGDVIGPYAKPEVDSSSYGSQALTALGAAPAAMLSMGRNLAGQSNPGTASQNRARNELDTAITELQASRVKELFGSQNLSDADRIAAARTVGTLNAQDAKALKNQLAIGERESFLRVRDALRNGLIKPSDLADDQALVQRGVALGILDPGLVRAGARSKAPDARDEARKAPGILDEARAAIGAGAPRDKVIERLRANGIDTTGL
jgi:hypothetical protein